MYVDNLMFITDCVPYNYFVLYKTRQWIFSLEDVISVRGRFSGMPDDIRNSFGLRKLQSLRVRELCMARMCDVA